MPELSPSATAILREMQEYHHHRLAQWDAQRRRTQKPWSLARAISKMAVDSLDGAEREFFARAAENAGRDFDPMRVYLPFSELGQRDFTAAGEGANLISSMPRTAVDTLRPYSVVLSLGAQVLEGLVGNTPLPFVSGGATGSWLTNEATTASPSDPVFSSTTLTPRNYAALTSISRQLRLEGPQTEPVVRTHLARLVASAIDAAALSGPGTSGAPTGLTAVSGTQTQSGTTLNHTGTTNMLELAVTNGANDLNVAFITTPPVRELLQNRTRESGSGIFVWDDSTVAGKPGYATTNIASASMVCGDFSQVVIGFFGNGIELTVDPFTAFKTGVVTIRAIVSCDVGILFPGSFCKSTTIT